MCARAGFVVTLIALFAGLASAQEPSVGPDGLPSYEVRRGDTLSAIALQVGKTQAELLSLNPGLEPDRIREGQRIKVADVGRRIEHVIAPGEVLSRLAQRYEVTVAELVRWNPELTPDRVRVGQELLVYTRVPTSRSESIGTPTRGKLAHGELLSVHAGYVVRNPGRAWGTREVVDGIVKAFTALRAKRPDVPKVRVHDLSLRGGGPIDDHNSHQSGRDVDITYFQKRCQGPCALRRVGPSDLDVEAQWALLEHFLERGQLEAVFIDYALQAKLYAHARAQGAAREELAHWFQYPRGDGASLGIIRHARGHADHMHLRFACDDTDAECEMFRVMPIRSTLAAR
jgi:LysM repeat protein